MTILQLINTLKMYQKLYGNDIKVVLSTDPEGNSYSTTDMRQIISIRDGEDKAFSDIFKATKGNRANFDNIMDEELKKHKVIGLCIYPFDEGFDTAEKAVKEV